MSDNIQDINVDDDEYLDAPKALRDHVKKIQERLHEITKERDAYKGRATSAALGDVLGGFKNPDRVKRDLLADKIDPLDGEAVKKWLTENGDDYAKGTAEQPSTPSVDPSEVEAHEKLNAGAELRQPADMSKLEAALAEITPEMTGEQITEVYRKHGV